MDDFEPDDYEEELNSPRFRHGMDIGISLGLYEAYVEARVAYDAGEIDLWMAFHEPKSFEEWEEWEKEHGDLSDRWKKQ